MNEALAILGGNPINQFTFGRYPTVRDVLRFYMQFWKLRGSESRKEKLVATALIEFYNNSPQRSTDRLINEQTIKNRLARHVARLKSVVKNRSRKRSGWHNHLERNFSSSLDSIFEIRTQSSNNTVENATSTMEGTLMESESHGTYLKYFVIHFLNNSNIYFNFSLDLKAAKKCY